VRERRGRTTKAQTTKAIEQALGELLAMPAVPFAMAGDDFCAAHFASAGPQFAARLAQTSERHPALRRILERVLEGESVAVLLIGLTSYMLPPLLHHGLIPTPPGVAEMFGVPARAAGNGQPEPDPGDAFWAGYRADDAAPDAPAAPASSAPH
jgi:hypothetical protein